VPKPLKDWCGQAAAQLPRDTERQLKEKLNGQEWRKSGLSKGTHLNLPPDQCDYCGLTAYWSTATIDAPDGTED
jgi:hypothetical protein